MRAEFEDQFKASGLLLEVKLAEAQTKLTEAQKTHDDALKQHDTGMC